MPTPEDKVREKIDQALFKAGWQIQDTKEANLHAGRGVVLRSFPLVSGHGFADYLLYIDGKAAGVIEAKKEGFPLVGVEVQAVKYSEGLPAALPAYIRPLPFLYQSTGIETRFTNGLDPDPRSRRTFAFHRPDTLAEWLEEASVKTDEIVRPLIGFRAYMRTGRFTREGTITTNIANLSVGRFAKIAFPLPSLEEQQEIVAEVERRLSVIDELEASVEANLTGADRLRQSILSQVFDGRLLKGSSSSSTQW